MNADILVWPNPLSENLFIDFGEHEEGGTVKIVGSTGMVVLNKLFTSADQRLSLNITSLGAVLYDVVLESPNTNYNQKLVIIR